MFLVILGWGIWLQTLADKETIYNYLFNAGYASLYLVGGFLGLIRAKMFGLNDSIGKTCLFFGLSLTFFSSALFIWTYYNLVLQIEVPFPSIADILYVFFYLFAIMGFGYLIRLYQPVINTRIILESFLILFTIAVGIFFFNTFIREAANRSNLADFFNFFYPLSDILMVSISLIGLRVAKGKMQFGFLLFVAAMLFQSAADLTFSYRTSYMTYWNGDISDILYAVGGFLFSLGLINAISSFADIE